jgi:hypothetical protein
VIFAVEKVALGQVYFRRITFSPVSRQQVPTLTSLSMLILSEGQAGEAWELSNKGILLPKLRTLKKSFLSFSFVKVNFNL